MVIAYYIIGAALAAWMATGNAHLDWKLSLLVLPIMFFGHLCYDAIAGKRGDKRFVSRSPISACLACHSAIALVRRLGHHRFCCDEHEQIYLAELQELGVTRLHRARIAASLEPSVVNVLHGEGDVNVGNHALVKFQSVANLAA